jgi:hypothetical protein
VTTELATRAELTPTLFGTDDPVLVVERATKIADALAGVIEAKQLFSMIRGRKHVRVEGWTLLGSMVGVFASVEWSRPLAYPPGFEARAVAHNVRGDELGAADAQCTRAEGRWADADDYAIRSMAQTRAISKVLRMPLGFIVELAGYSATPAEELEEPQARPQQRSSRGARPTAAYQQLRDEVLAAAQVRGIDDAELSTIAADAGVEGRATIPQLRAMLKTIEEREVPDDAAGLPDSDDEPEIAY